MKQTLTIEQSARLIELGVDVTIASSSVIHDEIGHRSYMAVFTLADLLAILPKKITYNALTYAPNIWVDETSAWNVEYITLNGVFDDMGSSVRAEELIDAIYAEIAWLKENLELVWL